MNYLILTLKQPDAMNTNKSAKVSDTDILENAKSLNQKPIPTPKFNSFEDAVDWATMYLGFKSETYLAVSEKLPVKLDFGFRSIKTFDGAILLGEGHEVNQYDSGYNYTPIKDEVVNLSDIDYNLNGGKYFQISENISQTSERGNLLLKSRVLEPTELKGTPHVGKKVLELSYSRLLENETWFNVRLYFWVLPGKKGEFDKFCILPSLNTPKRVFGGIDLNDDYIPVMSQQIKMQFANYYQWFVYFKEANSIGFRIPIAPESCKEIFEIRDVSEAGRRKAMLHWVSKHYRSIKVSEYSDEYRQTIVKKHLRGETKFNWKGFEAHLIPSKYDIAKVGSKKQFFSVGN